MSRRTTEDFARETGPSLRALAGALRRMAITVTSRVLWQLTGHRVDEGTETVDVEVFSGVGFQSRPKGGHRAEAIVAHVGGSDHPVVVATRSEDARRAMPAMAADESMLHNSLALVIVKSDGTIEARTAGGSAQSLATKSDIDALTTYIKKQFHPSSGHIHATPSGPTTTITEGTVAGGTAPAAVGTTKLKGE